MVLVCFLALLMLYPLSMGPVMSYLMTQNSSMDFLIVPYLPLATVATIPEFGRPFVAYPTGGCPTATLKWMSIPIWAFAINDCGFFRQISPVDNRSGEN